MMRRLMFGAALMGLLAAPREAAAQLDPLVYVKRTKPNVLIAVETANRMLRDPNNDYRDANVYRRLAGSHAGWESALGISDDNTSTNYRRKYVGLAHQDWSLSGDDRFTADHIEIVGDRDDAYASFDEVTRIAIARRSLAEVINRNTAVARFGLFRTRQNNPTYVAISGSSPPMSTKWDVNEGPVRITSGAAAWSAQVSNSDMGSSGRWRITRPVVGGTNGSVAGPVGPLVAADNATANTSALTILNTPTGNAGSLLPAGRDSIFFVDAPVDNMLDDLKQEATRLIGLDTECRNTVVVLVVGGGEGTTTNENVVAKAATFLNVSGHRVPIYVIGIAPLSAAERTQLQNIASASGGQFTEITAAMVANTTAGQPVPEFVRAVNVAISHAFANQVDFDKAPDATHPYGYETEHQTTSPIVGTVNLENAKDITGAALPDTYIEHPVTNVEIPQRSNILVTAGYALPGFDGRLRAFRVYRPVTDTSKPSGYKFVSDGTKLWVASTPDAASRNIYTVLPNGTMVPFTAANAALLRPYLKASSTTSAATLIDFVRAQPLGSVMGSTPAIMDAPSLDPPPDADYPGFADQHKNRRSMIWVGGNDGMLHGIDARLGKEVWAFIPFNLLPKLRALQAGQPVGDFRFYMDGSPKVADVKIDGQWRTYLVIGQGAGGTFYQTFDVTLPGMGAAVAPDSDVLGDVLAYFSTTTSVPFKWSFPRYSDYDVNVGTWGDIAASASVVSKTVGETWSDPAVGQIESPSSPFTILTGSGFLKYSVQQQANRGGIVAGTTFYILNAKTGDVLDSRAITTDNKAENVDNCAAAAVNNCKELKNALQADPVATGPADSRYISKVYMGDLDGKIWRFDVGLDAALAPKVKQLVSLYTINTGTGTAAEHPVFSSMAMVSVGNAQQYLFVGTGSDLLPRNGVNTQYAMLVILDQGTTGSRTAMVKLEVTDGAAGDEKVSAFPAVAGDIVFFSTTTYRPASVCTMPDANLYAFTFIGGPAYDTNGDGTVSSGGDSQKVRSTTGARATAPFIVDQHLVFGTGNQIEMFGDPQDFNNGVGQSGVRILSWREVR